MPRWLVALSALAAACYSEPRPACGFVCGEGGDCPGGYTCSSADNRCHLDGTPTECQSFIDAMPMDHSPPFVLDEFPLPAATGDGASPRVQLGCASVADCDAGQLRHRAELRAVRPVEPAPQ